jgi:hypothetical protein
VERKVPHGYSCSVVAKTNIADSFGGLSPV